MSEIKPKVVDGEAVCSDDCPGIGEGCCGSEYAEGADLVVSEGFATGQATCRSCGHEWTAVVPAPHKTMLECPRCRAMSGAIALYAVPAVCGLATIEADINLWQSHGEWKARAEQAEADNEKLNRIVRKMAEELASTWNAVGYLGKRDWTAVGIVSRFEENE